VLWGIAPRRGKTSLYFLRETNSANGLVIDKDRSGNSLLSGEPLQGKIQNIVR
jgi:hypothetical protein